MNRHCRHPEGCEKRVFALGWCRMHYERMRRYGSPGPAGSIGRKAPLEERFVNRVQIHGPIPPGAPQLGACSVWTGYVHPSGFGVIRTGHRFIYVHRYAWQRAYGPVPRGRVKQICGNRLCVRADHLALATSWGG